MTNSEIREDLEQAKGIFRDYHTSAVPTGLLDALCENIETLLAREAEVQVVIQKVVNEAYDRTTSQDSSADVYNLGVRLIRKIRAILEPQEPRT